MASRIHFANNSEIGCFVNLTNTYCLVAIEDSNNFASIFENDLGGSDEFRICRTTIGGIRNVGTMTVGNSKGLLVPDSTTDQELQSIRNTLPDSVRVLRLEERLSALGNVIVCNDYVALCHPDLDQNTYELIQDVLGVEVFRTTIHKENLVGTYCVLTNQGALVHPKTSRAALQELAALLQVPVVAGTVNHGSGVIKGGVVSNDFTAYCGQDTTATELGVIEEIFKLKDTSMPREALIDSIQ